jgi:hypothetical protein
MEELDGIVDPEHVPEHEHGECPGCASLRVRVDALEAAVPVAPVIDESEDDTKPAGVPWTHRGFGDSHD